MNTTTAAPAAVHKTNCSLRLRFGKLGALGYISHLDLMRTMTKLLVRARLPLAYSEGFNPIPRLTFSPPLSLGVVSDCELLDVRLLGEPSEHSPDKIKLALKELLPPDLPLYEVYFPDSDLGKIASADYTVTFTSPLVAEGAADKMRQLLSGDELVILKKTKSGPKNVNISPMIYSSEVISREGYITLKCRLGAGSDSFLNPILLANCLFDRCGLFTGREDAEYFEIKKTAMYFADGRPFR